MGIGGRLGLMLLWQRRKQPWRVRVRRDISTRLGAPPLTKPLHGPSSESSTAWTEKRVVAGVGREVGETTRLPSSLLVFHGLPPHPPQTVTTSVDQLLTQLLSS